MSDLGELQRGGITTHARAWDITRLDGTVLGFTDHDYDLDFGGLIYRASSALTGAEVEAHTGLTADNGAVRGALQNAAISERDLINGLYDNANVRAWLVNWADVELREIIFSGFLGEIEIADGSFTAELRSHSEKLNQPLGRRYLRNCGAKLGSAACGVDLDAPDHAVDVTVTAISATQLTVEGISHLTANWFDQGVLTRGTQSWRVDRHEVKVSRHILNLPLLKPGALAAGEPVVVTVGCDKTPNTCKAKFDNLINFQGFPFIPGEDSALATPKAGGGN
ncbi:MAG: DUF2163 domain-containing protein [Pseudomonadota bacterium]